MIRIVTFYHEVSCIFIYGVVYGTNEEHTCSASYHCIIMHFAQHSWMSPSSGRDRTGTTSYVARGGVRRSFVPYWVWRQWTCHMHYICIHGDLYIEALDIFIEMWISGSISLWLRFVYLFHMKLDVLNVIHLRLNCCVMNLLFK